MKGIYGFKVKGGPGGTEGYWIVDAKNGSGSVVFNGTGLYNYYNKMADNKTIFLINKSIANVTSEYLLFE